MPAYVFTGLVPTLYPFDRDAAGQPLGEVQPGDVRDLDEPRDWQWVPAGDQPPPPGDDVPPAPESAPEPPADAAPEPAPADPGPADPGPQPAPPAAVPSAFAVTTG